MSESNHVTASGTLDWSQPHDPKSFDPIFPEAMAPQPGLDPRPWHGKENPFEALFQHFNHQIEMLRLEVAAQSAPAEAESPAETGKKGKGSKTEADPNAIG